MAGNAAVKEGVRFHFDKYEAIEENCRSKLEQCFEPLPNLNFQPNRRK